MNNFLKKIHGSSDSTKQKWVILFSGLAMVAVVFLWMSYFNSLVSGFGAPQQAEQEASRGLTFWQTFKSGLGLVIQTIGGAMHSLLEAIKQPTDYIIKP